MLLEESNFDSGELCNEKYSFQMNQQFLPHWSGWLIKIGWWGTNYLCAEYVNLDE